ncbi:MAG TPA: tRNA-(ms[2]io[6]A)-hydroxylase [Myxococcales bacterium]|nr:tRNA-(ms[2]io[6]A)-hydroxylase [Myxococcales bacterium]
MTLSLSSRIVRSGSVSSACSATCQRTFPSHSFPLDQNPSHGVLNRCWEAAVKVDSGDIKLRYSTPPEWTQLVLSDVDMFMQDHAHQERKVSSMALKLAAHHPNRTELVVTMIELAREELKHFKQVVDLLHSRGKTLGFDTPDPYVGPLARMIRDPDSNAFLLNRLVLFAIVESRGCERFQLIAEALTVEPVKRFYTKLAEAELRHRGMFLDLAYLYYEKDRVDARLDSLLDAEAELISSLEIRLALH